MGPPLDRISGGSLEANFDPAHLRPGREWEMEIGLTQPLGRRRKTEFYEPGTTNLRTYFDCN